jgi:SynChlorMet cassette protein ScmC
MPDILCDIGSEGNRGIEFTKMRQATFPIFQRVHDNGGLPLHAALLEKDGRGVLLGGSGGMGKSTCCSRIPPHWHALCDDETLIVQHSQRKYRAHPFPTWSYYIGGGFERTWKVERSIPLSRIFFLEQSETDEVVPIGQGQAAIMIYQLANQVWQRFWGDPSKDQRRAHNRRLFNNASELAKNVPSYILRASLSGRFWEEMEKVKGERPEADLRL